MTSAKNSKVENFLGEDTPRPPYKVRALAIMFSPRKALKSLNIADTKRSRKQDGRKNISVILAARDRKRINDTQCAIQFSRSATGRS